MEVSIRSLWTHVIEGMVLSALAACVPLPLAAQCSGLTVLGRVDGVSGNPFQAEVSGVLPAVPRETKPLLVARDTQGRVRIDTPEGTFRVKEPSGRETEIERHNIVVCDPVSMKMITFDTLNKTATVRPIGKVPSTTQRNRSFCDVELHLSWNPPNVKLEDLGHRTIEGVDAHGIRELRTRASGEPTSNDSERQLWCSEELGAMILLVMDTPQKKGAFHFAMTNIQRAEPPGALFSIPADYEVLERLDAGPEFPRR